MAPAASRRGLAPTLLTVVAFVVVIVVVVGAPLVRSGVLLPTDLVYLGYPWRADDTNAGLAAVSQGPLSDTVDGVYPNRDAVRQGIEDRDLPLWDPYSAGGSALAAIPSTGSFNPINSPYLVAPMDWAPALAKAVELLVAMAATFAFARAIGLSRGAGAIAGIVYACSGFATMWTNWPQSQVAALLPAVLWGTEVALRRRRSLAIVPVALAVGSLLLGGFPAVAVHGLLLAGAYAVVRSLTIASSWRGRAEALGRAAVGVVLGVLLASFLLVPFARGLGQSDLAYRAQTPDHHLPVEALTTVLTEKALGLSNHGGYVGTGNQVETVSFIGVGAVTLAAAALVLRRPRAVPDQLRGFFGIAAVAIGVPLFFGGPSLALLQQIPTLDENPIGRARAVLALCVAVLAAMGVDALREVETDGWRRVLGRLVAVITVGGAVLVVAVRHLQEQVEPTGHLPQSRHDLLVAAALGLVAAGLALVAYLLRARPQVALVPLVLLGLLTTGDSARFARSMMPSGTEERLYPRTEAHTWLVDHLGHERFASDGITMYPDSNSLFGLRSANGHAFHARTWKQALLEVDPKAFSASPTFSQLHPEATVIASPGLDRLGARYFVVNPLAAVVGDRDPGGATADGTAIGPDPVSITVTGPARAVTLPVAAVGPAGRMVLEAVRADGTVFGRSSRLPSEVGPGQRDIAVPGDAIPADERWTLRATGRDGGTLTLATADLGVVRPDDDGLVVAYADDVTIYERTRALPRIRYAPRAVVEKGTDRPSVPSDTVLVVAGSDDTTGGTGTVTVLEDGPDEVVAEVVSDGDGHLVIADAMQSGWVATVDGEGAPLVPADGAGVAVALDQGTHRVVVRYTPPGRGLGLALTALGGLVVLLVAAGAAWRRLRGDEVPVGGFDRRHEVHGG